jgi:hypothetical protein
MPLVCSVCAHPRRAEIDVALAAHEPLRNGSERRRRRFSGAGSLQVSRTDASAAGNLFTSPSSRIAVAPSTAFRWTAWLLNEDVVTPDFVLQIQ